MVDEHLDEVGLLVDGRHARRVPARRSLPQPLDERGVVVVGEQPRLQPGEDFSYTSGVMLQTDHGTMQGHYDMVADDGTVDWLALDALTAESPSARTRLHEVVAPVVRAEADRRGLKVFDATCPLVTKVHFEVARHCRAGRDVVLIGHAGHPEVEGTMGQWNREAGTGQIYLVEDVEQVATLQINQPDNFAYTTQTTLSVDDTRGIIDALRERFPAMQGPKNDDICYATQNRQDAVKQLAGECDVVLVVGSPNSSNSNRLRELAERGNAPANKVLQYEREVEALTAERGEILSRIASVRQQIGEAELQITQAQKTFLEQVETDLRTTQARLFESAERLHATTAELGRMEVRAPESGVVVDMAFHTVDGVIGPGGRIMDIVPQNDQLVVDAQIRPADIDGLQVGMEAEIRFPAFNQRTTPMIHGQLKTVSADRLVDPKTNMPYFNVRVLVDEKSKESISGLNIIPGMPAEVVIKKGERTLLSYLIQPMRDTFVRAMRE